MFKNYRRQIFAKTEQGLLILTGHNNDVYSAVYRSELITRIYTTDIEGLLAIV